MHAIDIFFWEGLSIDHFEMNSSYQVSIIVSNKPDLPEDIDEQIVKVSSEIRILR